MYKLVWVCVCVCVREREREKEREILQSSCKYASPFADPKAIFSLVGQSIVGRPFPAICCLFYQVFLTRNIMHRVQLISKTSNIM